MTDGLAVTASRAASSSVLPGTIPASRTRAAAASLDVVGVDRRSGAAYSLRRVLPHLVQEYALHNGHADLLRERIDGATGV